MENVEIKDQVVALITKASTDLPLDIEQRLRVIRDSEDPESSCRFAMEAILQNVEAARREKVPICQDTGTLIFEIHYPSNVSINRLCKQIEVAIVEATAKSLLRPNAVDSITGKNSGNNLGIGQPYFHFTEWEEDRLQIQLLLKGGGSENVGCQYSLPHSALNAGRDLDGVAKTVIDAVFQAQGKGCGPGFIGVGIGGDRGTGFLLAKKQLFRPVDDSNPDPKLQELEQRLYNDLNKLGIGTMGFGGKYTVLAVKVGAMHRLPASYFVSIAYLCWAARRATLVIDSNGQATIS